MNSLQEFKIPYLGLKIGVHNYEFAITNAFFECFELAPEDDYKLQLNLQLTKQSTMLILDFSFSGYVNTLCDRCNEPLRLEIKNENKLFAKLGNENNFDNPEIVVINENEGVIDISQFTFEFIQLNTPLRKTHSEQTENQCNPKILEKLEGEVEIEQTEEIDPRWAALKGLKNDK